jgi:hypothetical protein
MELLLIWQVDFSQLPIRDAVGAGEGRVCGDLAIIYLYNCATIKSSITLVEPRSSCEIAAQERRRQINVQYTVTTEAHAMDSAESGNSTPRRARLAAKGQILYAKSCGTKGKMSCVEGFALYHIERGEPEIARDLLGFLETRSEALRSSDPEGQLARTDELTARIRRYLDSDPDEMTRSRNSR